MLIEKFDTNFALIYKSFLKILLEIATEVASNDENKSFSIN